MNQHAVSYSNRYVVLSYKMCALPRVGRYQKYYTAIIATGSLRLLPRYCIGIIYYNKQGAASLHMCAIRKCNSIPLYWYESVGFNSSCWYKFN